MESSTRNLIIMLALPHLSREEDRVAFLAEQAALGALYQHGPEVARKALQTATELLRDDFARHMIVEAITRQVAAAAQGDAATPAAEPAASKPAPAPKANEASLSDPGYVISLESVDAASVDGAVRALASMAMTGGFTEEEAQKSARKWVARVRDGVPTAVARAESTQEADEACALLAAAGARALTVPAAKWKQQVVEKMTRALLAVRPVDGAPLEPVRYPEPSPPEEIRKSQSDGVFVNGDDEDDDGVFVAFNRETVSCGVAFVRSGSDGVVALPGGGLALTQTFVLRPPGAATPVMEEIVHRVIPRPDNEPILVHRFAGMPTARLLIVVPTKEGHSLHIDADVPVRFTPGLCPMVAPEHLVALPGEVLNAEFVRDENVALDISRDSESGKVRISAAYRPANAPPSEATPETSPPEETPAPAVVSPGYHVVLVSPGPLPNDKLVGAIANSVKDHGNGVGLPEQEALVYARQVVNANSFDDGVIVAHAASRDDAEVVRKILHSTGVGVRAMVIPAVAKVPAPPEAQSAGDPVPQTPEGESPTPSAAQEAVDGRWYSVVMTGRGVPPYGYLVHRLALILLPSQARLARGTKHHEEMMARAEERLANIDGPLEIARYESREIAECVRASILRNSSPGTLVKVVPAPRLNVTCCLFNEEWSPVAAPDQPGAASRDVYRSGVVIEPGAATRELSMSGVMSGVTHKPAKKARRSR